MPKTFFVNEHGVVQSLENWEQRLKPNDELSPVTDAIRAQWTSAEARLDAGEVARLVKSIDAKPNDLALAIDLASRYLDLGLNREAGGVLKRAVQQYNARQIAGGEETESSRLLGQAYFQLARASFGKREEQVRYATISFYLNPSVGYGKQIARIIAPEKFDHRPRGDFDNRFREGTLRRLRQERENWLRAEP